MKPRDAAIAALQMRQCDVVPHFELEMQLAREYFGRDFTSREQWAADPSLRARYLGSDASLFVEIADAFDYCAILYSHVHRPTEDDYIEGICRLREADGARRLLLAHGDSTLSITDGSGMAQLAIDLYEHPARLKDREDRKVDEALEKAPRLMKAGIEGFALCSDYCFNSGPFMSPSMFAEFVAPYLTRLISGYREMGACVIKHTDGDIMPILDQLVAAGPHALHSLDPMAGVDVREVKRLYGNKVCLIGNVNCALMQTGTDEDILSSCRYAMESCKPGGGYIFSTTHVMPASANVESVAAAFEHVLEVGKY